MSSKITASTVHGKGAGRPLSGSMTDMRWPLTLQIKVGFLMSAEQSGEWTEGEKKERVVYVKIRGRVMLLCSTQTLGPRRVEGRGTCLKLISGDENGRRWRVGAQAVQYGIGCNIKISKVRGNTNEC